MTKQLTLHNLINLKKKMEGFDCEYSKKILAVVEECIPVARAISKKKDEERRSAYQFEDVTCETCGKDYPRGYIYKHRQNKHGVVSAKPKKETDVTEVLQKLLSEFNKGKA